MAGIWLLRSREPPFAVKYVIKNKADDDDGGPSVGYRDVKQTYDAGSIGYCFAPRAVIHQQQAAALGEQSRFGP